MSSEVEAAGTATEVAEAETLAEAARRAGAVDDELIALYPDAACALEHDGPFQLLVAGPLVRTLFRRLFPVGSVL